MSESMQPVILITGQPGSGKSLYAVSQYLKGKASVYSCGLKGSIFPEVDATKWWETPSGSCIVVDEAWKFFAPKSATAEPPEHYKRVPEIRHSGHTLILITQHPNDLDARIRRRVGKHFHLVRIFGTERANVHEWNTCTENVDDRTDTESSVWEYDKAAYGLYKSAEVHKIKTEIPRRVKRIPMFVAAAVLMVGVGLWTAYRSIGQQGAEKVNAQAAAMGRGGLPGLQARPAAKEKGPMTTMEYVASYAPRIEGLTHTAPRYDEITKPTEAPYPAACIATKRECKCYTQQGTRLDTPDDLCRQIVARGFFMEWESNKSKSGLVNADQGKLIGPEPNAQVAAARVSADLDMLEFAARNRR